MTDAGIQNSHPEYQKGKQENKFEFESDRHGNNDLRVEAVNTRFINLVQESCQAGVDRNPPYPAP